jgi:putative ABC transport system substrate-binding protein
MPDRRTFIVTLAAGTLGAPLTALAQRSATEYLVGFLSPAGPSGGHDPLWQTLRDLGYVRGQNLIVEYRHGPYERLADLAADLVRLKSDVIVAVGPPSVLAAKGATATIPIVFVASDPVGNGLVASLSRPERNLTGVAYDAGIEMWGKQLQMLKEIVPTLSIVIVPIPSGPSGRLTLFSEALPTAARALGVRIELIEGREPSDFERGLKNRSRKGAEAMMVPPAPFFFNHARWVTEMAARNRLATVYGGREFVLAGGLMAYGPNNDALFRQVGSYVGKILKGAKPGDLSIEEPTKFELVINQQTAKALGLTIPPSLLLRADQVIE